MQALMFQHSPSRLASTELPVARKQGLSGAVKVVFDFRG